MPDMISRSPGSAADVDTKMDMTVKRLYQVAGQFNLSSQAMVKLARDLGFTVKNHMSVATDEIMAAVRGELDRQKNALKKEIEEKQRRLMERRTRLQKRKVPPKPFSPTPGRTPVPQEHPPREVRTVPPVLNRVEGLAAKALVPPGKAPVVGRDTDPRKRRRRRGERRKERVVDQREVAASFKRTIAKLGGPARPKRHRRTRGPDDTGPEVGTGNVIEVTEYMSVAELAHKMDVNPAEVVAKCLELGMMATINQRLDLDTIETIALEFDFDTKEVAEIGAELIEEPEASDLKKFPRPPVVTIMGHVDHGKTSLLDHVRQSNIVAGESGGITQHIGAYVVDLPKGRICFLDTPGHQAFTAMRARGAHITDLVVLVVAQDDRVMPQTIEAIDHAQAANVPIIVAINKMDLPGADAKPVIDQLAKRGLLPEEWGGNVQMVPISARTGQGIEILLEGILLSAEMLELTAAIDRPAKGVVVDARLDRGRGPQATVLIREGVLRAGDNFVAGEAFGRVRQMHDERNRPVSEAGPSIPVVVTGFSRVPQAGDTFVATESDQVAREVSRQRERVRREHLYRGLRKIHLTDIHERIKEGQVKELRLVIKGDVDGSVEVLADTLGKIKSEEVAVNIIHRGVGSINESDVLLAAASDAVVLGFHVRPDARAREVAHRENVDIKFYNIIYEVEADIRAALEGMLTPGTEEEETGRAEVRNVFRISRIGTVAGCVVVQGTVHRGDRMHLVRDGVEMYDGQIGTLRRFKDDVKEVGSGYECGIRLENFNDLKVGDVMEAYQIKELERKLE